MAEIVPDATLEQNHTKSKHDWTNWTNGSTWKLTRGVDFDARPESIRAQAFQYAKRRNLKCQTAQDINDKDVVYIKFSRFTTN